MIKSAKEILALDWGRRLWKRHDGLPRQRHEEIGMELKAIRDRLMALHTEVSNAYPKQDRHSKTAVQRLGRALAHLDQVRNALEELYARQHPDTWSTDIYYGPLADIEDAVEDLLRDLEW